MIEFSTSPKGEIASDIFEKAKEALGVMAASRWMFSANAWLNGRTPIQAIREGDGEAVKAAANNVKKPDESCPF